MIATGLLVSLVSVVVYIPGLDGPFLFDDLSNILLVTSLAIKSLSIESLRDALTSADGELVGRPLARLTFALNYYLSGQRFDPMVFKITNLAIHVLTGACVFVLCNLLGRSRAREDPPPNTRRRHWFSMLTAALWLLHPIQLTSVLYAVQRMNSLATFFVVVGLIMFCSGRSRLEAARPGAWLVMTTGVVLGTGLGSLCKETAVVTPALALLLSYFFWDSASLPARQRRQLVTVSLLLGVLTICLATMFLVTRWEWLLSLYDIRQFSLGERLLTEPRVVLWYLSLIIFPDVGRFALFHDGIEPSRTLVDPWSTLVCLVIVALLFVAIVWGLRRRFVWAFGLSWFFVGHGLESSVLGLELVFEHRNYLPSLGLFLSFAHMLVCGRWVQGLRVPWLLGVGIVAVLAFSTAARASIWGSRLSLAEVSVRNHPESYRARELLAVAYRETGKPIADIYTAYRDAAGINPAAVIPLIEMLRTVRVVSHFGTNIPVGDDVFSTNPLQADFSWTLSWLDAIEGRIDDEVLARLQHYPLESGTALALHNLHSCAMSGDAGCELLAPNLKVWIGTAMVNSKMTSVQRAILTDASNTMSANSQQ